MGISWQQIIPFLRSVSATSLGEENILSITNFLGHDVFCDVSWPYVIRLAELEGVSGFLYSSMKRLGLLDRIPDSALQDLELQYLQTKGRTLAMLHEAELLSTMFEKASIEAIALQGICLVSALYKDLGLRPLGDIDLLVKPYCQDRLKECLLRAGYRAVDPVYPNVMSKGAIALDIHVNPLNLERIGARRFIFPEDSELIWQRAIPMFSSSQGLLRPDISDNFSLLSAHALKHGYSRLIWMVDLHESLRALEKVQGGWQLIVDGASRWKQQRAVAYALVLVEKMFGLVAPAQVRKSLGTNRLTRLERLLLDLKEKGLSSPLLCNALWIAQINRPLDKVRLLVETLFPKPDVMAQIFPQMKIPSQSRRAYWRRIIEAARLVGKDLKQAARLLGVSL